MLLSVFDDNNNPVIFMFEEKGEYYYAEYSFCKEACKG